MKVREGGLRRDAIGRYRFAISGAGSPIRVRGMPPQSETSQKRRENRKIAKSTFWERNITRSRELKTGWR